MSVQSWDIGACIEHCCVLFPNDTGSLGLDFTALVYGKRYQGWDLRKQYVCLFFRELLAGSKLYLEREKQVQSMQSYNIRKAINCERSLHCHKLVFPLS